LASFLQTVVQTLDFTKMNLKPEDLENVSTRTLRAAQVFIACVPVLMMYPFLQKYFVKGMTLGSVKE
jgi:putative aldouronate transport system permease protein